MPCTSIDRQLIAIELYKAPLSSLCYRRPGYILLMSVAHLICRVSYRIACTLSWYFDLVSVHIPATTCMHMP